MRRKAEPLAITRCQNCCGPFPANQTECPYCGSGNALVKQLPISAVLPAHASESLSLMMLLVVAAFILAMALHIAPLHALDSPGRRLIQLLATTSLTLAALGLKDATRLANSPRAGSLDPVRWFAYLLLAWPVTLPLYFRMRSKLGLADRSWLAGAMSVASIMALAALALFIDRREEKYRPSAIRHRVEVQQHHWPVLHGPAEPHGHTHSPETPPHEHPHSAHEQRHTTSSHSQADHSSHHLSGVNHGHRM